MSLQKLGKTWFKCSILNLKLGQFKQQVSIRGEQICKKTATVSHSLFFQCNQEEQGHT